MGLGPGVEEGNNSRKAGRKERREVDAHSECNAHSPLLPLLEMVLL